MYASESHGVHRAGIMLALASVKKHLQKSVDNYCKSLACAYSFFNWQRRGRTFLELVADIKGRSESFSSLPLNNHHTLKDSIPFSLLRGPSRCTVFSAMAPPHLLFLVTLLAATNSAQTTFPPPLENSQCSNLANSNDYDYYCCSESDNKYTCTSPIISITIRPN